MPWPVSAFHPGGPTGRAVASICAIIAAGGVEVWCSRVRNALCGKCFRCWLPDVR